MREKMHLLCAKVLLKETPRCRHFTKPEPVCRRPAHLRYPTVIRDLTPKAESPFPLSRVKMEDALGEGPASRSRLCIPAGANKKASIVGHFKDGANLGEGPSLTKLSG